MFGVTSHCHRFVCPSSQVGFGERCSELYTHAGSGQDNVKILGLEKEECGAENHARTGSGHVDYPE